MNQFTIHNSNPIDAEYGSFSIPVTVNGYWSSEPIRIYVTRNWYGNIPVKWDIEVSHSSGGRDTDKVQDNLQASENFAQALLAAVKYARELEARFPEFEEAFQKRKALDKEFRLVEEAKKKELFDADQELGVEKAKLLVEQLSANRVGSINGVVRGQDKAQHFVMAKRHGNVVFYYNGTVTSKKQIIEFLSKLSHRTTFKG